MALRHTIRLVLLAVLVWRIAVYWDLFLRDWAGWKKLRRRKRRRKRRGKWYKKAKPFAGLTRKPVCALCEQGESEIGEAPSEGPPPRIEHKRGAKRRVDTANHFCPNKACRYYGWLGLGNIVANGHPSGGRWRQLKCEVCGKYFQETKGTVFYRSSVPAEKILYGIASLCEGVGIGPVARIYGVDVNTVFGWLGEASGHVKAVSRYMLHELHVTQVQLDELYVLLGGKKEKSEAEERTSRREKRRHCWLWGAIDAESKLLMAVEIGDRSLETAQRVVHTVVSVLAAGVVPLFVSDQLAAYGKALLTHYGEWVEQRQEGKRRRKRRWMPLPALRYVQVVKRRTRRRLVAVTQRVVYGTWESVRETLRAVGQRVNTSFIERVNRTLRAHVAALVRRGEHVAKSEAGVERQAVLVHGYYNLCLPHGSLREELPRPIPTKGTGSQKKWRQRTPGMAAGITDHVWRVSELLMLRVPPWWQQVAV